jgi:hypothetical protein
MCRGCGQRNWEVTKEAGGLLASSLKDKAMCWESPTQRPKERHQTLENMPRALLKASYQCSRGKLYLPHNLPAPLKDEGLSPDCRKDLKTH